MATIKEVAELAGISIGTVSHVITGSVPVSHIFSSPRIFRICRQTERQQGYADRLASFLRVPVPEAGHRSLSEWNGNFKSLQDLAKVPKPTVRRSGQERSDRVLPGTHFLPGRYWPAY